MIRSDLIAKLREATEGSRELDYEIAQAFPDKYGPVESLRAADEVGLQWGALPIPHWSTSLDAALTLVPEGMEWGIHGNLWKYDLSAYVRKWVDDDLTVYSSRRPGVPTPNITPALALCIAALRARATTR